MQLSNVNYETTAKCAWNPNIGLYARYIIERNPGEKSERPGKAILGGIQSCRSEVNAPKGLSLLISVCRSRPNRAKSPQIRIRRWVRQWVSNDSPTREATPLWA